MFLKVRTALLRRSGSHSDRNADKYSFERCMVRSFSAARVRGVRGRLLLTLKFQVPDILWRHHRYAYFIIYHHRCTYLIIYLYDSWLYEKVRWRRTWRWLCRHTNGYRTNGMQSRQTLMNVGDYWRLSRYRVLAGCWAPLILRHYSIYLIIAHFLYGDSANWFVYCFSILVKSGPAQKSKY